MAGRQLTGDMVRQDARGNGCPGLYTVQPTWHECITPLVCPPCTQAALRAYVLADTGAQNQADSTVRLVITHSNLRASFMDIRLDMHVSGGVAGPGGPPPGVAAGSQAWERGPSLASMLEPDKLVPVYGHACRLPRTLDALPGSGPCPPRPPAPPPPDDH